MQIKYSKLNPNAKPPSRKNPTDAGLDFYSCEGITIPPHSMQIVHTGIAIQIPENYFLLLKPKGKNNHLVGAGVVDAYYEPGEILIKITNIAPEPLYIDIGDSIAQGIFIPIITPKLLEVDISQLSNNTNRSASGGIVNQDKERKILEELG